MAGRIVATATVLIKANTDQFRSAISGLGSGLSGSFSKLTGLIAGIGLGHLAAEAIRFGAEYRIQLDNAQAAVNGLTDSQAEAKNLMKDMVDLAINTPFDLPGVQDATIRLLAYGEGFNITSENVTQYVRTIGNAAAATGKGADAMNNTITIMGKISGQGRVMTRDLNQLTANFPSLHPWEILSEMTGQSVSELRRLSLLPGGLSGVVDATEFIEHLVDAMEELPGASADWDGLSKATGKTVEQLKNLNEDDLMAVFRQYPEMADAMSRKMFTLGGTMEVFKDTMGVALADGLMPFFATMQQLMLDDNIKKALTTLATTFGDLAGMLAKELAPILPSLINSFQHILVALMPLMPAIADLAMVLALMLVEMAPLIELLASFAAAVMDLIMKMDPHLLGVIAMAFVALWFAISSPISGIILGIALLAAVIWANWDNIKKWTSDLIAKMVELWDSFFETVIDPIINFVKGVIEWFQNLYDTLVGHSIIPDMVNAIIEWFTTLWNVIVGIVNVIKDVVIAVWNAIKVAVEAVVSAIAFVVTTYFNIYKTIITTAINVIRTVIETVWNAIKSVVTTVLHGIESVITSVWNGIKSTVTTVVNAIKSTVTSVWNAIKDTATTVWNGIKTAIMTPINLAKDLISGVVDTIKGFFNFSGLLSTVTGVWNSIKEAILGPIRSAADLVGGILDRITGPVSTAIEGVKGATGWIPGTPWANGGVYWGKAPLPSVIHGPEAMIPLSNPMRAMQVMHEAGLDRMLANMQGSRNYNGPLVSMPGAVIQDATDADLVAQRTLAAMTAAMVA
jgi:tape measure domain-containing protein